MCLAQAPRKLAKAENKPSEGSPREAFQPLPGRKWQGRDLHRNFHTFTFSPKNRPNYQCFSVSAGNLVSPSPEENFGPAPRWCLK